MPSRIEHRASFPAPAPSVYSALVDKAFLEDRLRVLGGKGAALLDHVADGGAVSYRLRQGLDAQHLPSAARAVLKGDLVVEREERWQPDGDAFAGTVRATIPGVPGEIRGRFRLAGAGAGSALDTEAEVKVSIPLIGGKIESVIAEQVGKLLATETEFAAQWLAEHP